MGFLRPGAEDDPEGAFRGFCERSGYEPAGVVVAPAAGDDTAAFVELVDLLAAQPRAFLAVAVERPEALGMTAAAALNRVWQLQSLGARVLSMDGSSSPGQALLERWRDEERGTARGDRIRTAMRRRVVRGEALGRPPYGYRIGGRRRLELVPEEAQVVRYIFRMSLQEGLGVRRIAGRLNQEGYRTRSDGPWSMVTVRNILRNRVYAGTYVRFGVRVAGSHAPLVQAAAFDQVQHRLDARAPRSEQRRGEPFALVGVARCAGCGEPMTGVTRRGRWMRRDGTLQVREYRYYQCSSRLNRTVCEYRTWRAADLEERVRLLLADALDGLPTTDVHPPQAAAGSADARRMRQRAGMARRRLWALYDAAVTGRVREQEFADRAVEAAGRLLEAERALAGRTASTSAATDLRGTLARLVDAWHTLPHGDLRRMLESAVARVDVDRDQVQVRLRGA